MAVFNLEYQYVVETEIQLARHRFSPATVTRHRKEERAWAATFTDESLYVFFFVPHIHGSRKKKGKEKYEIKTKSNIVHINGTVKLGVWKAKRYKTSWWKRDNRQRNKKNSMRGNSAFISLFFFLFSIDIL